MNDFYIYAHYKPDDDTPFYIGKGRRKRAYQKYGRSLWWHRIVNKYGCKIEILYGGLTELSAFDLETSLICCYGRHDLGEGQLINHTDGGEGPTGYRHSTKTKNLQRMATLGKIRSDETKEKMRNAQLGQKNPRYGKSPTEETRQKMSLAHIKHGFTDEHRRNLIEANKQRWSKWRQQNGR